MKKVLFVVALLLMSCGDWEDANGQQHHGVSVCGIIDITCLVSFAGFLITRKIMRRQNYAGQLNRRPT